MPTEKSLANLKHQKPRWENQPSKAIRVPNIFSDKLIAIAMAMDLGEELIIVRKGEVKDLLSKVKRRKKSASSSLDAVGKELEKINLLHTTEEQNTNG